MINKMIYIILWIIFHPIRMLKTLKHCEKNNHHYNMHTHNFNFDVWCADCGEVFSDEVK